jgi:endonuclease/exonuclease/phosphatase family metal-dependent hydrolase
MSTQRWRLFVCNTYLIPAMSVNADNASCQQQDERAAALGRAILASQADVVMLQECWGAGQGSLERELTRRFDVGVFCRSWFSVTLLDSIAQFVMARGGLYFAHDKTTVTNVTEAARGNVAVWCTFKNSKTRSKKGAMCVRYKRQSMPSGADLLVFNTHLDPTNEDDVQLRQLAELADFVRQCVADNTGPVGCVLVGDFNFRRSDPQHHQMFEIMRERGVLLGDLLASSDDRNKHTYSDRNPLVMWPTSRGRIDHIFSIDRVGDKSLSSVTLVSDKVRSDIVVSDHYPFEAEIDILDEDEAE